MIKNRNLLVLGAVVVVLAAVSVLQQVAHHRATTRPDTASLTGAGLDKDSLTRFVLGFGSDTTAVVLERLPDSWVVRTAYGRKASQQRVDELVKSLTTLSGEFRSDAAGVLEDYSLTPEKAVRIEAFGKDFAPVFSLLVGKQPTGQIGNFVRKPNSNQVYLSSASVLGSLGLWSGPAKPQSRQFLDLEAYKGTAEDVNAIVLDDNGKITELTKEFPKTATEPKPAAAATDSAAAKPAGPDRSVFEWKLVKPQAKPALKTKADALLSAATMVRAVDVADPDGDLMAYGLWKAARKATLTFKDGKTFTLFFGASRPEAADVPGGVFMRTDADRTIWVVRDAMVNAIFVKPDDLLPGAKPASGTPVAAKSAKPAKPAAKPAAKAKSAPGAVEPAAPK
jgi:hypothetical protein